MRTTSPMAGRRGRSCAPLELGTILALPELKAAGADGEKMPAGAGFVSCIRGSIFQLDKFDMSDSLDRAVDILHTLDSLSFS